MKYDFWSDDNLNVLSQSYCHAVSGPVGESVKNNILDL